MRDIDRWAAIVQEAEDGYTSLTSQASKDDAASSPTSRIPPERYKRLTVKQLIDKIKQNVEPYEQDFTVKFIDMKTKKEHSLVVMTTRVDPEIDELQIFFDFK